MHKQLPDPTARWGAGGYLLPLSPAHLSALDPAVFRDLSPGRPVTVRLSETQTVPAICDHFVEQWGMSEPKIFIGVLARVAPGKLPKFHSVHSNYFLAYHGPEPTPPAEPSHEQFLGTGEVLNNLGSSGQLVLAHGEIGWNITLYRRFSGKLMATNIAYFYGD